MWKMRGIVEGANHSPFEHEDRLEFIEWLSKRHYNTYVYGSKFDPLQNEEWRRWLNWGQHNRIVETFEFAQSVGIDYYYALRLVKRSRRVERVIDDVYVKISALADAGCPGFALFFDDLPTDTDSLAHVDIVNGVYDLLRGYQDCHNMIVCPQAYHGTSEQYGPYLSAYEILHPKIGVCYTGPQVVSPTITKEDALNVGSFVKRCPIIWDNYFCDDLDLTPELGPLRGRSKDLGTVCRGWLGNTARNWRDMQLSLEKTSQYLLDPTSYTEE